MLGDGKELEWVMTKQGMTIKTPEKKVKYQTHSIWFPPDIEFG